MRVGHAPRGEHDRAGTSRKLVLTDKEHVLALDHVEEFVLIRVDVQRRVERIYLLDDRECTARRLRARLDEEDRTCEGQALSGARVEVVAVWTSVSDSANLTHAIAGIHARCCAYRNVLEARRAWSVFRTHGGRFIRWRSARARSIVQA